MFLKTRAIVLNTIKYSENSLLLHAFTEEYGRSTYVVNGIKSKKCTVRASLLLPLSIIEMEAEHHPKKEIHRIKESKTVFPFSSIPFDPVKNSVALLLSEILFKCLKETDKNDSLFNFLIHAICYLDSTSNTVANFHLSFLVKLSAFLGFYPNADNDRNNTYFDLRNGCFLHERPLHNQYLDYTESDLLKGLLYHELKTVHLLPCSRNQRNNMLEHLIQYYHLHLSDFGQIKSLGVLKELFV